MTEWCFVEVSFLLCTRVQLRTMSGAPQRKVPLMGQRRTTAQAAPPPLSRDNTAGIFEFLKKCLRSSCLTVVPRVGGRGEERVPTAGSPYPRFPPLLSFFQTATHLYAYQLHAQCFFLSLFFRLFFLLSFVTVAPSSLTLRTWCSLVWLKLATDGLSI